MKQTVKYVVAAMCFACLSMNNVWAVAPLPGLGLTEHVRKPIPQGIVHQQRAARAAYLPLLSTISTTPLALNIGVLISASHLPIPIMKSPFFSFSF